MSRHIATIAAIALVTLAGPAGAQAGHSSHGTRTHADTSAKEAPCPLHLTTLALTPVQDTALRAIRAAHMAEMRAVAARVGATGRQADTAHAAMKEPMHASMARATDAVRAILTDSQRTTFEAAVAAHAVAKAHREGTDARHDCAACCREHEHAAKREG